MPRNIEIKASVDGGIDGLLPRARALADGPPQAIAQDDTFFACTHGRLKLRDFGDGRGELIQYQRVDATGPKTSTYVRVPTASPDTLREALTRALGQIGRVRKQRTLLMVGRTRIHLDCVEGLGDFVELEVVLADDEPESAGLAEAHRLMQALGITPEQLLAGAYLDLLAASALGAPPPRRAPHGSR